MKSFLVSTVAATLLSGVLGDDHTPFFTATTAYFSEAVEYDSTNNKLYLTNFFGGILYSVDYDAAAIENGTFSLAESDLTAFDNGNYTLFYPAGMYSDGTSLYVANIAVGLITVYDIASMMAIGELWVFYSSEGNGTMANLNGMCEDPTNADIFYVTDTGFNSDFTGYEERAALYKVDASTQSYEKVADFGLEVNPNGCAVSSDGNTVYMIGSTTLWKLDVSSGNYSAYSGYENSGDGLVFDDDWNLYVAAWTNGTLWELDGYDSDDMVLTPEVVSRGLTNPGDIAYDSDNNWIIIPSVTFSVDGGAFWWVDLDEEDSHDDDSHDHSHDDDSAYSRQCGAVLMFLSLMSAFLA